MNWYLISGITVCRNDTDCNGGTCISATTTRGAYCECLPGYTGDYCTESKQICPLKNYLECCWLECSPFLCNKVSV